MLKHSIFKCPHCGHTQREPSHLISTFCRFCSQHYATKNDYSFIPSAPRFRKKSRVTNQVLHCHRCGNRQVTSVHAQTTLCTQCNTSISLTDIVIDHYMVQEVDTRKQLLISPHGHLEGGTSICNSALIKGKISGTLICEKAIRLQAKGKCIAKLIAKQVIVERGADLYFHFPLYIEELVVFGKLTATIFCQGYIYIHKKGFLEGLVWARAMEVCRKGEYKGNLKIQHDQPYEASSIPLPLFEAPLKANTRQRPESWRDSPI